MQLLFVTQEVGKIPSGVVTVLTQLCKQWPESDLITVLMNQGHWARTYLQDELHSRGNISLLPVPSWLMFDELSLLLTYGPRSGRVFLKLLLTPIIWVESFFLLLWLVLWIRKNRISGIISHNGGWPGGRLNRLAVYAGKLAAIPERMMVIHNTPAMPASLMGKVVDSVRRRMVGWATTRIIAVSNACRQSLETVGFGKALDVVYNGIEDEAISLSDGEGCIPWEKSGPTVAFVGQLHARKGVHVLLEAMQYVNETCEVVLIGNGDAAYRSKLEQLSSHLTHPVHFLGFRDDVSGLYRWIDVLVLPSLQFESFGMVIVEAMRAGIPVICSDFGGMKEVVADGTTGFVVPAGDAKALAIALDTLLNDEELRHRMGVAGRRRQETNFTSQAMVGAYARFMYSA